MTDPQMPQDKSFENREGVLKKDFKIQDLDWGEPHESKGDTYLKRLDTYRLDHKMEYEAEELLVSGFQKHSIYNLKSTWYIQGQIRVTSKDGWGVVKLDFNYEDNGEIGTCIKKLDSDKRLPKGLGVFLYDKFHSFFRSIPRNDLFIAKYDEGYPEEYNHEVLRDPNISDNKLSRKRWYELFGLYLAKYRYSKSQDADRWKKKFLKIYDLSEVEVVDFDWDEGAVYDSDAQDVRIKPSIFQESIKVDDHEAIIQGSSRKYYKISSEGKKFLHELVDLKLTIGEASVIIKLKFEGNQLSSEIIPGDSEHQIDQEVIDSFVFKLDHYLKYKAIEDGQDYEYKGKVYKAGEEAEKKLVKEYLESKGVVFPGDESIKS